MNVQNGWNWFNIVKHNDKAHFNDKNQLNCVFHVDAYSCYYLGNGEQIACIQSIEFEKIV